MSSKVYFLPWIKINELHKFLRTTGIFNQIKARSFLAIKVHFGEDGNMGHINPNYISPLVKIIKKKTAYPFLTDASTIYVGERSDAYHHLLIANKHGFTVEKCGCPVIIADGLRGSSEEKIEVNLKHFRTISIAKEIYDSDGCIFLSHVKGHGIVGFGGALKNIGMGCGSKAGKYAMHHSSKPTINIERCIGCGNCINYCYQKALSIVNAKVVMNKAQCAGCGQCVVNCTVKVFGLKWNEDSLTVQEKMVEYAAGILKNKSGSYVSYINFLNNISKYCDCVSLSSNKPLMKDVGVVIGTDPVAVDQASYDLINKVFGKNLFKDMYPEIKSTVQLEYAEKLGVGSRKYELVHY
jgi:uncharacterized Fe-S center protein